VPVDGEALLLSPLRRRRGPGLSSARRGVPEQPAGREGPVLRLRDGPREHGPGADRRRRPRIPRRVPELRPRGRGQGPDAPAGLRPGSRPSLPASTPAASPPPRSLGPASSPAPPEAGAERMPARRVTPVEGPAVASGRRPPAWDVVIDPSAANARPTAPSPPPPSARTARAEPVAPLPPQANRAGSYSLARQLRLGARRIVIDAGHGGHDPGTRRSGGVQEKDVVLDVAL